ncbi:galactosyl transferase GMA12/MNN10 family-domain-containing protein [Gamsiella multidivaricata]|uniref:galactosyl transferase GMA12/MNN10 family-domain-containing protein n=1 Tax=Gamsiella multidivaricata TaxID=101098 RepID=UPI00221F92C5|nr:galactosyl transferase GMA12/MNN10 family-domain-containing protein [Gamsiella multidivaricata]KAG0365603.1 hypothetical protein BGZ54_006386 [Gamsiella multidivaricata]KAI7825169.1 galactosyl transferase GMA12/MNN10 family-domain-containing protein [Gamsiella multidivaricata]
MAVSTRKLYWITAGVFLLVVFLSYHKNSIIPYTNQPKNYNDNDEGYESSAKGAVYTGDKSTPSPPPTGSQLPNVPGKYDTLILIPSSWTQMHNRQWVRQTIFGINNNLEPCKRYDGKIIYKFYIHGYATWLKTPIHSAEFMQGQIRDLYGEFMEYNDHFFINKTVTDRHAVWGDALAWAVETFIPQEQITVDKVLIFDSTTLVNLPKMEERVKTAVNPNGFLYTWGAPKPFAGMVSYNVAEQIVKSLTAIRENNKLEDLFTASTLYFTKPAPKFKVESGPAQIWASDIDELQTASQAIGPVYQLEDWTPIVQKLVIQPTAPCAADTSRKKNIALLTSSYIYVDMCMAEASLPSAANKRDYAAKHGYDFVARAAEFAQEDYTGRRLVWGKIAAIQKVLPHYEWLFWMDMDAVIADMGKDLREIIQRAEEASVGKEISLIVARPVKDKMLNAGVMLIKNTNWSRQFLNEVQTRKDWYRKSSYEQAAIWEAMLDPKWASGVYLFDKDDRTMNTFPKQYREGDFVIHFAPAGCPSVSVLEALQKIKNGQSLLGVKRSNRN